MKIIFVNPPQPKVSNLTHSDELEWIPLGLCYLSAVAKEQEYDTKVFDFARKSFKQMEYILKTEKPDFLGISCWTDTRINSIKTIKLIKEMFPNIKVIVGGSHATFFPEQMFELAPVDVVVLGEGETTLKELLQAYKQKNYLITIKGIVYKNNNNQLIHTGHRDLIINLDNISYPNYNGLDLTKYKGDDEFSRAKGTINGMMLSSRGCPFRCTFCSTCLYWERKWRARSPKNIVDEMQLLYNKFGVTNIRFWDDHFTLDKVRAVNICKEIINRQLHKKITWSTSLRVDCIDDNTISYMKRAGCNKLIFGVESGSQTILNNIKKGFTVKHIEDAFELCHKYKVYANASIMVGNPGETEATIDETIAVLKRIKPDNLIRGGSILWVFPGTEIYEDVKKHNQITDAFWLTTNPILYYTLDQTFEELIMLSNRLTFGLITRNEKIKYMFSKGFKLIFKNPRRLLKVLLYYITKKRV